MATLETIKRDIAEIATRSKNVRFEEIERIVTALHKLGWPVGMRPVRHGVLFRVHRRMFQVCRHNRGGSQIKECYVRGFLEAMTDLELYEANNE